MPTTQEQWWDEGRREEAIEAWRSLVRFGRRPGDILVLADALAQSGRVAETLAVLDDGLEMLRSGTPEDLADALLLAARCHHLLGNRDGVARCLGERATAVAASHGPTDGRSIVAIAAHAVALARAGRTGEAATIIEPCLTEAALRHDLTVVGITVQRARGEIARLAGDHATAWEHLAHALADARELAGDASELTRSVLLPFALASEAAGQPEQAVEAYHAYLADAPEDSGPGFELARMRLGQLGELVPEPSLLPLPPQYAERLALTTWVRDDGEQTPQALEARWHLAESLRARGRMLEAAEEFARLRDDHEEAGRDELALAAWNAAAMLWEEVSPVGTVEDEYRAALARSEEVLGEEHPMTVSLRHNLADSLERRGEHDQAAWLFGHNVLGQAPDSTVGINARRRLAWSLALSQRLQQGLLVARRALAEAEATLTPGAEATLDIRNTMAFCLEMLGDEDGARELYEQNLVEAESTLGKASSVVLPYRNNLARMYLADARHDEALALYRTSADVVREAVAGGQLRDIEVLRHLAECLERAGDKQEAAEVHGEFVAAVVASDGVASERAHRARWAWARTVVAASADAVANVDAVELAGPEAAYAAAAVLEAAGESARAARVRLRFDLDDAVVGTEDTRSDVAEALVVAQHLRENGGGDAARELLAGVVGSTAGLEPDDPARSGATISLAAAMVADGLERAAIEMVEGELELLARAGTWGSRAGRLAVAWLRARWLAHGDWVRHDDLLARDLAELDATLPPNDERVVLAQVLLAGALRRRGHAGAARALLLAGQARLTGQEPEGIAAILRIATTKAMAARPEARTNPALEEER